MTIQQNFSIINQFEHKWIASQVKTSNKNVCTNTKTAEAGLLARLLQAHWVYQAARRRPTLRRPYIILRFFFFRQLPSDLTKRNRTKFCDMIGSDWIWKYISKVWVFPRLKSGVKTTGWAKKPYCSLKVWNFRICWHRISLYVANCSVFYLE